MGLGLKWYRLAVSLFLALFLHCGKNGYPLLSNPNRKMQLFHYSYGSSISWTLGSNADPVTHHSYWVRCPLSLLEIGGVNPISLTPHRERSSLTRNTVGKVENYPLPTWEKHPLPYRCQLGVLNKHDLRAVITKTIKFCLLSWLQNLLSSGNLFLPSKNTLGRLIFVVTYRK